MNITFERVEGPPPVTILRLQGDLDGTTYRDVIDRARELHAQGSRNLLIDLSETPYMSSAGLVALHQIALLFRGGEPPDPEAAGWQALRALADVPVMGVEENVKLLRPQARVVDVLTRSGFLALFEVHTDQAAAVISF